MKPILFVVFTLILATGCSHKLKQVGRVTEHVKSIGAISADAENVYMQLILERKKGSESLEGTQWLKASKTDFWKGSNPSTIYQSTRVRERYPPIVEYEGENYEIYLGNLSTSVSKGDGYGTWKLVDDFTHFPELREIERIQLESGSQIDPQSPIFGESKSDLFLFSYPDRVPEIVLLDREEKKALVIREFRTPSTYTITDEQYDSFKSALMPAAKTADVGIVILAAPVLIPLFLNADFSGK